MSDSLATEKKIISCCEFISYSESFHQLVYWLIFLVLKIKSITEALVKLSLWKVSLSDLFCKSNWWSLSQFTRSAAFLESESETAEFYHEWYELKSSHIIVFLAEIIFWKLLFTVHSLLFSVRDFSL